MNNLLITGDFHITDKIPQNRIDNFEEALLIKLNFIFETAKQNDCIILQPGDFFDSPSPSYKLFTKIVKLLNIYKRTTIYSILGQHDLRFRNTENIASKALEQSCKNFILLSNICLPFNNLFIYPASYNEKIPKIRDPKEFNILLIHKMILQEKIWWEQTEYADASNFLRTNAFQLVVSGDNHQGFICDQKTTGKRLFNCGSLTRSKIDQVNHKPFIIIFDTDTKEYKQIFIPIEPPEKVFNLEKVEREKEKNENLEAFVAGLSSDKEIGLKFEDNLNAFMAEINVKSDIRQIIEEAKIWKSKLNHPI